MSVASRRLDGVEDRREGRPRRAGGVPVARPARVGPQQRPGGLAERRPGLLGFAVQVDPARPGQPVGRQPPQLRPQPGLGVQGAGAGQRQQAGQPLQLGRGPRAGRDGAEGGVERRPPRRRVGQADEADQQAQGERAEQQQPDADGDAATVGRQLHGRHQDHGGGQRQRRRTQQPPDHAPVASRSASSSRRTSVSAAIAWPRIARSMVCRLNLARSNRSVSRWTASGRTRAWPSTRAAYSNGASAACRGRPLAARPRSIRAQAAITALRGSGSRSRSSRVSSSSSASSACRCLGPPRRRRSAASWAKTIASSAATVTATASTGSQVKRVSTAGSSRVLGGAGAGTLAGGSGSANQARSRNSQTASAASNGSSSTSMPLRRALGAGRRWSGSMASSASTPLARTATASSSPSVSTSSIGKRGRPWPPASGPRRLPSATSASSPLAASASSTTLEAGGQRRPGCLKSATPFVAAHVPPRRRYAPTVAGGCAPLHSPPRPKACGDPGGGGLRPGIPPKTQACGDPGGGASVPQLQGSAARPNARGMRDRGGSGGGGLDGCGGQVDQFVDLGVGGDQGGAEEEQVAVGAVGAAGGPVQEQAAVAGGGDHPFGEAVVAGEGRAGGAVGDQLDRDQQAEAADVAGGGMAAEAGLQAGPQALALGLGRLHQPPLAQHPQHLEPGGGADHVVGVGEAV